MLQRQTRLRSDVIIEQSHGTGHERDLTGNEHLRRVHLHALTVRPDVRRCPVRHTLHVHRVAHADVIVTPSSGDVELRSNVERKVCGDADARGRIEAEVTSVDAVDAREVAHVLDADVNGHQIGEADVITSQTI